MAEESLNSVRVFWLEQDKLLEDLKKAAIKIGREDKNVKKILLFGSLAEKRGVPGSDADILVVLERDDRSFRDRIADWNDKFALNFPIEVFPFTPEELDSPIAIEALRKGIVLFERTGL